MKQKFYKCLSAFFLPLLLFSSCGQNASASNREGDDLVTEELGYYPAKVIGPTTEFTLEDQITSVTQTYENVCDSYEKMQTLAGAKDASRKGKTAAAAIEKEYADRIAQLADTDFTQMTSEELTSLSLELIDMISAIREARDALTLG